MAILAIVVCIVDADDSVREGLGRLLESAGLDVESYAGVADLLREPPRRAGCALVDLSGPALRDAATRTQLRVIGAVLPIIAISAHDDPATRRLAREVGAQAFFRKPVDASALLDSIGWVTGDESRSKPS